MTTQTDNQTRQETQETRGKWGRGSIWREPNGKRVAAIEFHNGTTVRSESQRVDLKRAGCKTLWEAVQKACHATGWLPLFEKQEIKGTKALVNWYRRPSAPNQGWANVIKRGIPALKFEVERIDLQAMKAQTIGEALRKTAFQTGTIELKPNTTS
jgi:hypothetical protein